MQKLTKYLQAVTFAAAGVIGVLFAPRTVMAYENVTVVIDPGHGGIVADDNSNGGAIYNGVQEKDLTLITAQALYDELSQYSNVTVYMTRTTDVEMTLQQRVDYAKSVEADVLVSVHYNASKDHNFFGSEIFTSMYGTDYSTGAALGQCVMNEWNNFGTASKGIKTRQGKNGDYYGLIRLGHEAGMPAVILEHGYIDNDTDFKRMSDIAAWQQMGVLDANGIAAYYGLEKGVVKQKITPTVSVPTSDKPHLPDTTPPTSVNLVIDEYNAEEGIVKYSLSAGEEEDDLMYFGFIKGDITEDTVCSKLDKWDTSVGIQKGTFEVGKNFEGKLTARVYNTYELYSDSNTLDLTTTVPEFDEGEAEAMRNAPDDPQSADASEDTAPNEGNKGRVINLKNGKVDDGMIDITPEMVDKAENEISSSSKSLVGLVATISVIALVVVIGIAIAIAAAIHRHRAKRHRGNNRKRNEWDEDYYEY